MSRPTPADSHHPGPPRFLRVGEPLVDPAFVDADHGFDRDDLAPTVAGPPERDPDNYGADAFTWSVASRPDGSTAKLGFALTPYDDVPRYDHGRHNVAEFVPDAPGTYVLELDAPDGTHELTLRVFECAPVAPTGGPPRLELEGTYDAAAGAFRLGSNPELAPDSRADPDDLVVEYLPHDASSLSREEIVVDGTTARVPAAALDGPTSVYAAPFDGWRLGVTDQVVLDPRDGSVSLPNRPPAWLDDAVVYEIFTRSFAGEPGETDFPFLTERVDYLADLGVDVVWLTPVHPAWTATAEAPPGGPHGYSPGDYFAVAEDLGTLAEFDAFVDACHERGIRVCFDLVLDHCGWTHDVFQDTVAGVGPDPADPGEFPDVLAWDRDSKYFDWVARRADGTDRDAAPAATSFFGTRFQPSLNYGTLALREHALAVVEFWAERVDAFRCDIAWGVPHSFWREARERVRDDDPGFLLLDETVPRTPAFAAPEFDLHFDTTGFTDAVQAVARGDRPPAALLDAVEARRADGFPRFARLLNATENHDEPRVYHEASEHGGREDPARAQRAAVAAAFTLPGVPMLYYGQERLVCAHGTRRARPYEDCPDRSEDIEDDPYKRAFVNWETCPDEHLAFYRSLVAFYHDSPVLGPSASLVRVPGAVSATVDAHGGADDDLLVFGREAGDERRVVVVNFAGEPRTVTLDLPADTTNRFTGEDVGVARNDGNSVTVAVDTLVVLQTPTLRGPGR